ncbi:MFS transporter [Pseudoclavibacter soli]|uniref:MFS transporter n=1 Tax=Pseudoclavibacter soli TaxID=452623 RepID=UPI00040A3990|nr:MFS transporter [Pseudoclavibacter soli]
MTVTTAAVPRRRILGWALWDWGSAAFNAVATTFVLSVWLTSAAFVGDRDLVAQRNDDLAAGLTSSPAIDAVTAQLAQHSSWLGWALSAAGVVVALAAPVLGQRTDATGGRRRSLTITTAATVACLAAIAFVHPDASQLWFGILALAIGSVFFELASVEYNALLPEVSTPDNVGRVSGFGWGMGYLGGIVLLAIVLVGFIQPEVGWFGVSDTDGTRYRGVAVLCGVWFAAFALPVLLQRDPAGTRALDARPRQSILATYRRLLADIASLWRTSRDTVWFLFSSAVYRDGLAGVFTFGGIIAAGTYGFGSSEVIVFAIAANVISGVATIVLGLFEDRLGARLVIAVSLIGMTIAALAVFFGTSGGKTVFWIFGMLLCVFVGPAQSASRALLTKFIPEGRQGEIFGLYATTGRAVSFLAPAAFAAAVALGGAQIWGVLGIAAVLLLGLALFAKVRVPHA